MATAGCKSNPAEVLSKTVFEKKRAVFVGTEGLTSESLAWLQLQRANMMGVFAPYLVHDTLQPLTAICNYSSGLIVKNACCQSATEELSDVLTVINEEAFRASAIVKQLSNKSDSNLSEVCLVNVNDLIRKSLQLAGGFLRSEHVSIRTKFSDNLPLVLANPDGLEQVILNLIKNAAEAMRTLLSASRSVDISTRAKLGAIHIVIEDFGPWIPDGDFANLGCPFFTTKTASLGLGLWASKTILRHSTGQLLFQRRAPQGLAALIRLPNGDATTLAQLPS